MTEDLKMVTLLRVLRQLKDYFDSFSLRYWLDQGALLGAVRDGAFISYDNDVDLGIFYSDTLKLLEHLPDLKKLGFEVEVHCTNVTLIKEKAVVTFLVYQPIGELYVQINSVFVNYDDFPDIHNTLTAKLQQVKRFYDIACFRDLQTIHDRSVDQNAFSLTRYGFSRFIVKKLSLYLWKKYGGEYFGYVTPKHFYENFGSVLLHDMEFKSPSSVEAYLEYKYGENWRVPCGAGVWNIYDDDGGIVHHKEIIEKYSDRLTTDELWRKRG